MEKNHEHHIHQFPPVSEVLVDAYELSQKAFRPMLERISPLIGVLLILHMLDRFAIPYAQMFPYNLLLGLSGFTSGLVTIFVQYLIARMLIESEYSPIKSHQDYYIRELSRSLPYLWVVVLPMIVFAITIAAVALIAMVVPEFVLFGLAFGTICALVYFSALVSLSTYVHLAENKRGSKALIRSAEYIASHFWSISWVYASAALITIGLSVLASIVTAGASFLLGDIPIVSLVFDLATVLFQFVIITPLFVLISYTLYRTIREMRKENPLSEVEDRQVLRLQLKRVVLLLVVLCLAAFFAWKSYQG